ncbi:MAG: hypothetical protein NC350_03415 [Corallococcus sp.]|nr:hypothetical protein [Corallococcus sp.]
MFECNGLALFTDSINQLIECKLIMVDKQIAYLLKSIVKVPVLTRCLADTLKTSSYVTEFSRARITLTRPNGVVEAKLKIPTDRNRLFAFVVCLLTEVDSGRRNFIDFLKEYYYDADSNISYALFVEQVLKPFKRAGESILKSVDPDSLDIEAQARAEQYFYAERCYINTQTLRAMLSLCEVMRQKLDEQNFKTENDRIDAVTICNAMTNAIQLKNPRILRFVWIGFKNTLNVFADMRNDLEDMSKLLISALS